MDRLSAEKIERLTTLLNAAQLNRTEGSELFKLFDLNGDGVLRPSEFFAVMGQMSPSRKGMEIEQCLREIPDPNHDCQISLSQFLDSLVRNRLITSGEEAE